MVIAESSNHLELRNREVLNFVDHHHPEVGLVEGLNRRVREQATAMSDDVVVVEPVLSAQPPLELDGRLVPDSQQAFHHLVIVRASELRVV